MNNKEIGLKSQAGFFWLRMRSVVECCEHKTFKLYERWELS
jgi:hypothetical protein